MTINIHNYEEYMLDYLEGNLHGELKAEMERFLADHPELDMEDLPILSDLDENTFFSAKESLKKSAFEDEEYFQQQCIAYHENDLSSIDKEALLSYISQHPELKKEFDTFKKVYLIPDMSITYEQKGKLYQRKRTAVFYIQRIGSVAALLLIVFTIILMMQKTEIPSGVNSIATNEQPQQKPQPVEEVVPSDIVINNKGKIQPKPTTIVASVNTNKKVSVIKTAELVDKPNINKNKATIIRDTVPEKLTLIEAKEIGVEPQMLALQEVERFIPSDIPVIQSNDFQEIEDFLDNHIVQNTDKMLNKGVNILSRTGLGVLSSLTGRRLSYTKNEKGAIESIKMDSKLLAFDLPVQK
ncbi:hypothetical protein EYV94_17540 [Puteibacter caeruleilacunae]|nr:hypothetical protein EYV94_17540 [Puteibacter caeruleilacunae]